MKVEDHITWAQVVASKFRRERNIPIEHEEVLSLGMVGLMKAARNYEESKGPFRILAWIKIRGEIKDWVKTEMNRKRLVEIISLENISIRALPFVDGTEEKIINKELVEKLLGFASPKQVQALRLYYLDGYSLMEIAKKYGNIESNTWHLIHGGIKRIRKAMELGYV